MLDDYLELILRWSAQGENLEAKSWLEKNGLSTSRMKNGLLITGSRSQIETVFSVSLENRELPFLLPIPVELQSSVASITLPKPRSYHL